MVDYPPTTAINLSAVDRIWNLCNTLILEGIGAITALSQSIHGDTQALLLGVAKNQDSLIQITQTQASQSAALNAQTQALAMQQTAIAALSKTLNDLVTALGGGDQPALDAATAALQNVNQSLAAAVARDQPTT
jgi:hypothetical protein